MRRRRDGRLVPFLDQAFGSRLEGMSASTVRGTFDLLVRGVRARRYGEWFSPAMTRS